MVRFFNEALNLISLLRGHSVKFSFVSLAVGSAIALASTQAIAATIVGGSSLLSGSHATQLETWLQGTGLYSGNLQFTNVFTKGPTSTSHDFHAAADGVGPTITVLSATTFGVRPVTSLIGGFNPQSWSPAGYWNISTASDRTAFTFNLTTNDLRPQLAGDGGVYQTYNYSWYGPTFGGGNDLHVREGLQDGYNQPYSYGPSSCGNYCVGGPNFFGSNGYQPFYIDGLEVFTIQALSPSPVPGPVVGAGIPGILIALTGMLAWSRRRLATTAA